MKNEVIYTVHLFHLSTIYFVYEITNEDLLALLIKEE